MEAAEGVRGQSGLKSVVCLRLHQLLDAFVTSSPHGHLCFIITVTFPRGFHLLLSSESPAEKCRFSAVIQLWDLELRRVDVSLVTPPLWLFNSDINFQTFLRGFES